MKKMMLFSLLLLGGFSLANAQIEKGSLMLGGTGTMFAFNVAPNIGYFITDGLAVGAAVGLGFSSNDIGNTNSFNFGPLARYYIALADSAIKPFATASINLGRATNNPDQGEKTTLDNRSFLLGVGATYFLTKNIGLEAILGYNNMKTTSDVSGFEVENTVSNIGLNFGFQIFLGANE